MRVFSVSSKNLEALRKITKITILTKSCMQPPFPLLSFVALWLLRRLSPRCIDEGTMSAEVEALPRE